MSQAGPRRVDLAVGPTCISSGYCRHFAPEVFGSADDRRSVVLLSPVDDTSAVTEAYETCPVEAITVTDAATGEHLFP